MKKKINLSIEFDPIKISRGHEFVQSVKRGGKHIKRKSRRTDKQLREKDHGQD